MKYFIIAGAIVGALLVIVFEVSRRRQAEIPPPPSASTPAVAPKLPRPNKEGAGDWRPATNIVIKERAFEDPSSRLVGESAARVATAGRLASGEDELSVQFVTPAQPKAALTVYVRASEKSQVFDRTRAVDSLQKSIKEKTDQRIAAGLESYKLNQDIVVHDIRSTPAISWSADFRRSGAAWREYITRVQGNGYSMLYFLLAPADLENLKLGFDELVAEARLP